MTEYVITPAPAGYTLPLHADVDAHGCACSLLGGRCAKHGDMIRDIYDAWHADKTGVATDVIRSLADGYGYPGSMFDLGTYDWSGVRDSTERAVENMHAALHA